MCPSKSHFSDNSTQFFGNFPIFFKLIEVDESEGIGKSFEGGFRGDSDGIQMGLMGLARASREDSEGSQVGFEWDW